MRGQIGRCANEVMQEHSLEGEKTHSSSSIVELAPGTGGALPFDMIGEPSDGFFLFEALAQTSGCQRDVPPTRGSCHVVAGAPSANDQQGTPQKRQGHRFERRGSGRSLEFCQPSVNPGLPSLPPPHTPKVGWHPHCSYPLR